MDANDIDSPESQKSQIDNTSPPSDHHPVSVDRTPCPVKRRSLQFKDIQQKISEEGIGVQNVYGNGCFPPYNVEVTESSLLNKPVIPRSGLLANMANPFLCLDDYEDYPMKVQKPSGFGLHLNRVVSSDLQLNRVASSMQGCGTILGQKSSEMASLNTIATNSVFETCSASTKPLKGISANNSDLSLPIVARCEDLSSLSPYKRRKKVPITDVSYRRCNCRRTKCLKLYCDCFAAGDFCDKLCACQDCWNTELYEDTVSDVRQKIQSRNPLAFVPKIQQLVKDDGTGSTPSSARHKRGCNCKKSKCLKKYCECYQAKIGCTDGCRCEGCENALGRKDEYVVKKGSVLQLTQGTGEVTDLSSDMQLEMEAQKNDLSILHNMSPPIAPPSNQFPAYIEGAASSRHSSGNYLTSTLHANNRDIDNEMISMSPFDMDSLFNEAGNSRRFSSIPISQNWMTSTNDQIEYTSPIDSMNHFGGGNRFLDMPEIPTDTTVKVVSPSKKRVSSRGHETVMSRNSSSAGVNVMTGRKFILQAVPSSKPPFIDQEKNNGENKNDYYPF